MAEKKPAPKGASRSAKGNAAGHANEGLTNEERAAIREHVQELKGAARRGTNKADAEDEVLAKISAMQPADRAIGERLHAIIKANAPDLVPKTWYGMPAYARDGHVVCFFQSGQKFKTRYATLGFSDKANLDQGHMWPTAFALQQLTDAEERKICALIKRAVT